MSQLANLTFTLLVGLLVNLPAVSAQELKWDLKKDDQFTVTFEQETETSTFVTDRTTVTESSTTLTMDWVVKSVDDSSAVIEQSITGIKLSVGNPAVPSKNMAFDTGSTDLLPRATATVRDAVKPLIGLKFEVSMAPTGEIVSVSIPEPTLKTVRELPGSLQMQALLSEKGLMDLMGAAAIVLPEEKIETGQRWEMQAPVGTAFGDFIRTREYTYAGTQQENNREHAVFEIKSNIAPAATAKNPKTESSRLIEYTESGEMKLDVKGGYFVSGKTTSTVKTEKDYREKKIETTVVSTNQMNVVKK